MVTRPSPRLTRYAPRLPRFAFEIGDEALGQDVVGSVNAGGPGVASVDDPAAVDWSSFALGRESAGGDGESPCTGAGIEDSLSGLLRQPGREPGRLLAAVHQVPARRGVGGGDCCNGLQLRHRMQIGAAQFERRADAEGVDPVQRVHGRG